MAFLVFMRKSLAALFIIAALYNMWSLRRINVLMVDHILAGDYVIAVDHLPLTDRDKIYWFNDNKKVLQEQFNISMSDFNNIILIEAVEGVRDINNHWDENYYCFTQTQSEFRCVDKDLQVNIYRSEDNTLTFYIHSYGGIYVQALDGSIIKTNYENYFLDLDDRIGKNLDRWLLR